MNKHTPLPPQVAELSAALSQPRAMRRGSVNERRMKCGQTNCACQRDPKARHGPYYTLTRAAGGKTRSRYVAADQVPVLRDRKSTRLNSSHLVISYAVFCLKKKKHRPTFRLSYPTITRSS